MTNTGGTVTIALTAVGSGSVAPASLTVAGAASSSSASFTLNRSSGSGKTITMTAKVGGVTQLTVTMSSMRRTRRATSWVRDPMAAAQVRREGDEAGAVLVLALLFLVVVGLIVGGLASWTANNLSNTVKFQQDRNAQYALSSVSQVAIQNIRYTPLLGTNQTLNASPPSYCWGTTAPSELTVLGYQVAAWCSTVWNPTSGSTRVVTVSACLTAVVPDTNPAKCAAAPGLQTIVTFDDYSAQNPTVNPGVCISPPNGTCGSGMTINSSTIGTVNPTVSLIQSPAEGPAEGPATGGTVLTVTGTGFVPNSSGCSPAGTACSTTVNFVHATASANIVIPAIGVTVNSDTSLSVTTPPATTVGSYYVIVTTPVGSSLSGPTALFIYQPVIPTVTSVSTSPNTACVNNTIPPPCGSAAGGSSITIVGSGFLSKLAGDNTTVNFVDTANSAIVLHATNQTIDSSTSITATTPAIAQDSSYYVTVSTYPGGTSATGPVFTFTPLDPVVASVSPVSGGSGTSVTITGIGFVNGATTVQLIPTSGSGSTLTATNVSVSGSTTLTAKIPGGGSSNQTYYVEITTTTGGGSCPTQQNGGCASGGAAPIYTY